MQVRLAFSVMVQVDADILLIDEVLAVGDVAFQQKCFDVFNRLRDEGKTILFVTHDMAAVRRFCHRALLIERGKVRMIGEPDEVAAEYVDAELRRGLPRADGARRRASASGDGTAEMVEAWWSDEHGERVDALRQGGAARSTCACASTETVDAPGHRGGVRERAATSRSSPPPPSGSRSEHGQLPGGRRGGRSRSSLEMRFAPGASTRPRGSRTGAAAGSWTAGRV